MTTLHVKNDSVQAHNFITFARSLPYVVVEEKKDYSFHDLKPEVQETALKAARGEELIRPDSLEDMFKQLGI